MKRISIVISSVCLLLACGGENQDNSENNNIPIIPLIVGSPENVQVSNNAGKVSLSWNIPNTAVTYDIYVSTEDNLVHNNYASYDNSQWIRGVSSPFEYSPLDLKHQYFFAIVAINSNIESEQSEIVSSIPKYNDLGETVEDINSTLIWQKCSIGQTYNETAKTCSGRPERLSHDEVQTIIATSYPDWRLPTLSELMSLVYCSSGKPNYFLENIEQTCVSDGLNNAAIYPLLFPNTSIVDTNQYRTSTRRQVAGFEGTRLFEQVDFLNGTVSQIIGGEPTSLYTRLVKST